MSIGDAFSHTSGTIEKGLSQMGEKEDCRFKPGEESRLEVDLKNYKNSDLITPNKETEGITIYTYIERDGERIETKSKEMEGKASDLQVAFFYGEENVRFDIRPVVDERKVIIDAEIQNPKLLPASTYLALEERIKEFPRIHLYDECGRELQFEFRINTKEELSKEEKEIFENYINEKIDFTKQSCSIPDHINIKTNF